MSLVTGIVLILGPSDEHGPAAQAIDDWIVEKGFFKLQRDVDNLVTKTSKHPQVQLSVGGFNYFPYEKFVEFFEALIWEDPENVVLVLQHDDKPLRTIQPESPKESAEVAYWKRIARDLMQYAPTDWHLYNSEVTKKLGS